MISKKDLAFLYSDTRQAYARESREGEFKAWEEVLGQFSYSDVDASIRRWHNDTTIEEYTNRPRGSRMPTPTELKASIENFDKQESQKQRFVSCGHCEDGWVRIFTGLTSGGNPVDPKIGAVKRCQCFRDWVASRKSA